MRSIRVLAIVFLIILCTMTTPCSIYSLQNTMYGGVYTLTPTSYDGLWIHPILRVRGVYLAEIGGYSIKGIYVWNNTVYALTDEPALYRSSDYIHWERLYTFTGWIYNWTIRMPLFITSNGTILVFLVNTTHFAILRSTDYGQSFSVVYAYNDPSFGVWNAIETPNGTIFVAQYGFPDTYSYGLLWRSDDNGRTWSIVLNATDVIGIGTWHLHGVDFDPETNRLFAIAGEDAWALMWSDDYGRTWSYVRAKGEAWYPTSIVVDGRYLVVGQEYRVRHVHFIDKYSLDLFSLPKPAIQYTNVSALQFANHMVSVDGIVYVATVYDGGGLDIAVPPFGYGMAIKTSGGGYIVSNKDLDGVMALLCKTGGETKLVLFYKLSREEALYIVKNRYFIGYRMNGHSFLYPIYGYVKKMTIRLTRYDMVKTVVFYDGFEDGDISDWTIVSGSPTVTTEDAMRGKYSLKLNGGIVEKTIDVDIPAGEKVVIVASFKYYSILELPTTATKLVAIVRFSDGTKWNIVLGTGYTGYGLVNPDFFFKPRVPPNRWLTWISVHVPPKNITSITIRIESNGTDADVYYDEILVYIADQSKILLVDPGKGTSIYVLTPSIQDVYELWINGTKYTGETITLELNRYVTVLNITVPTDQVYIVDINVDGVYANVPLYMGVNAYYTRHGYSNVVLYSRGVHPVVYTTTLDAVIEAVSYRHSVLNVTIWAPADTRVVLIVYTPVEPATVKAYGRRLSPVLGMETFEKASYDCWYYDPATQLLYIKATAHSEIPLTIELVNLGGEPLLEPPYLALIALATVVIGTIVVFTRKRV